MKYHITWWKGDRELPSILILIDSNMDAANFHAEKGCDHHRADKAIIKDEAGALLREVPKGGPHA